MIVSIKRTLSKEGKTYVLIEIAQKGKHYFRATWNYPTTYYSWKSWFEQMSEEGVRHGMTKRHKKIDQMRSKVNTPMQYSKLKKNG